MNAPYETPGQPPADATTPNPGATGHGPAPNAYAAPPTETPTPSGGARRFDAQYAFDPRSKSPVVASFLSVVPGLGQAYIGHYWLAFVNILIAAGSITIMAHSRGDSIVLPLLPIFLFFFWLYNIVDAGRRAALYNYAVQGGAGINLPENAIAMPRTGGSVAAGLVLVVGGLIVLMHTRFGFSLSWVEDWWPLLPIAFGGWLIVRAIQDRSARADAVGASAGHVAGE